MFDGPTPTSETIPLSSVEVLTPCLPTKIIGLWNNFGAVAAKNDLDQPPEPLYFFKPPSGILAPGGTASGRWGIIPGSNVGLSARADRCLHCALL